MIPSTSIERKKLNHFQFLANYTNLDCDFCDKIIQKWIDESPRLKQLEKEYADFESRKNKHIDFSKFDWSLKPDDKVKK